jgi:hypothetical protein
MMRAEEVFMKKVDWHLFLTAVLLGTVLALAHAMKRGGL